MTLVLTVGLRVKCYPKLYKRPEEHEMSFSQSRVNQPAACMTPIFMSTPALMMDCSTHPA